ncbi:MAG: hypothetical protein JWO69_598, partial [Thermoleophilia bacterium]|nr:hypothetical protein [Thermoleophilia bacterium]
FSPELAERAGLTYEGIGRPGSVVGNPRRREQDAATASER